MDLTTGRLLRHMSQPNARGIPMMIVAVGAFAIMDACLKHLGQHHGPMQVAFLRGLASLPFVLLVLGFAGRLRELRPVRWEMHLFRGLLSVGLLWMFVYAVRILSLADAYSIYLCAPLLIAALSVPLLGERVEGRRWAAIAVGLAGVIVMLRPTASQWVTLGGLAAFGAAVFYSLSVMTIAVLARTDTTASMVFWTMTTIAVAAGLASISHWTPIAREEWLWIAVLGAAGAAGQHFITLAFKLAPASVVAPLEYTALLWALGFDWLIWNVLPQPRLFAGASLIIASGLYLLWREQRLTK